MSNEKAERIARAALRAYFESPDGFKKVDARVVAAVGWTMAESPTNSWLRNYLLSQEHSPRCVSDHIDLGMGCRCGLSAAMLEAGITREEYARVAERMFGAFMEPHDYSAERRATKRHER